MGKKTKTAPGPSMESVRRLLARGDAKAALKEAKVCHQRQADGAHRELLEQAYVARVEQLQRKKQLPEAREILTKLLDLTPSSPEVQQRLPALKVQVGMAGADATAVFTDNAPLLIEMTDESILDEKAIPPDVEGLKSRIANVREAFGAIERGDDSRAAELLADIPRTSPLSDWKLFLRGLTAFYQSDSDQAGKNWRRLDADRPAHRIAQTLLVAAGDLPEDQASRHVETGLRRLEARLKSDAAGELLERMGKAWRRNDWKGVVRGLDRMINRFGESHRGTIDKIADRAWKQAVRSEDRSLLKQLSRLDCARPLDPRWNRAWAMLEERSRSSKFETMEAYWRDYAEDLSEVSALSTEERSIASGLVYQRLARDILEYAKEWDSPGDDDPFFMADEEDPEDAVEVERLQRRAAACYEASIRRAPRLLPSYQELALLHANLDEPEQAAATVHRLVEQDPDDFPARIWLANHYLDQDEPEQAEPHVAAALRLKPREPAIDALRWNLQLTTIRTLALKRRFDEAREAWEAAVRETPDGVEEYTLDTVRAGLEYRAKDEAAAEEFVKAAVAKVKQPAPIWMQMSVTAVRFKLPAAVKKIYETRLKADIKKPLDSAAAGRIARFLLAYRLARIKYVGRVSHERLFVKSLQSKKRISWRAEDLRDVCRLLDDLPRHYHIYMKFVDRGRKRFPNDPFFLFWSTETSPRFGFATRWSLPGTIDRLKRVLELADARRSPQERALVEQAQKALALLEDAYRSQHSFFGFDDEEDFEDDADWDDGEEDFPASEDDPGQADRLDKFTAELPPEIQGIPTPVVIDTMKRMAEDMGINFEDVLEDMAAAEAKTEESDRKSSRGRKSK